MLTQPHKSHEHKKKIELFTSWSHLSDLWRGAEVVTTSLVARLSEMAGITRKQAQASTSSKESIVSRLESSRPRFVTLNVSDIKL